MKILMTLCLLVFLQACTQKTLGPDFGKSHDVNFTAQIVNADVDAAGETAVGMDGIKAGIAIEEYKTSDNKNRGERLVKDLSN